jgi:hypothetical protein
VIQFLTAGGEFSRSTALVVVDSEKKKRKTDDGTTDAEGFVHYIREVAGRA